MTALAFTAFEPNPWAIIFLVLGFILCGLEMIVPGFGIPGITGLFCLLFGIVMQARTVWDAALLILGVLVVLVIMLVCFTRSAQKGKISQSPIILHTTQAFDEQMEDLDYVTGCEGKTITNLRPEGLADIEGRRFEVISDAAFIPADTAIKVVAVSGKRIRVQRV